MNMKDHSIRLRVSDKIPYRWTRSDIRPALLAAGYSDNTINSVPSNASVSPDGVEQGDYVRRGRAAWFFRHGGGVYSLIDDPSMANTDERKSPELGVAAAPLPRPDERIEPQSANQVLTAEAVALALPRVAPGLARYEWLQQQVATTDTSTDLDFQRAFNGFYRVRRNAGWRGEFYAVLELEKAAPRGFEWVFDELLTRLGRYEASFASKLAATVDTDLPVVDAIVLSNLGLRLPYGGARRRKERIFAVYRSIVAWYQKALGSHAGKCAVALFDAAYPENRIGDLKKLDLIVWQIR